MPSRPPRCCAIASGPSSALTRHRTSGARADPAAGPRARGRADPPAQAFRGRPAADGVTRQGQTGDTPERGRAGADRTCRRRRRRGRPHRARTPRDADRARRVGRERQTASEPRDQPDAERPPPPSRAWTRDSSVAEALGQQQPRADARHDHQRDDEDAGVAGERDWHQRLRRVVDKESHVGAVERDAAQCVSGQGARSSNGSASGAWRRRDSCWYRPTCPWAT